MGAGIIGFVLGALAGAITGTEVGMFSGAAVGLLIGLTLHAFVWMRSHLGDATAVESHRVMCTPLGQVAECEFVGDARTGRWFDVRRCSLLQVPTDVECDKGCVRMISAGRVRPGGSCDCHAHA